MQQSIFDSIIDLTSQRDVDMLDTRLIANLNELFPGVNFSIFKLVDRDLAHQELDKVRYLTALTKHHDNAYDAVHKSVIAVDNEHPALRSIVQDKELKNACVKHNCVVIPLKISGNLAGALMAESENTLPPVQLLTNFVSVYQNNFHILNESERDKLTGLYNRKTFDNKISRLLKQQRVNHSYHIESDSDKDQRHMGTEDQAWIAVVDIDFFKSVNDNYGHVIGDEVLLILSQQMRKNFRSADLLFRFGGEEFVIVLEPTSRENALRIFDKFRQRIENHAFPQVGQITISTGFTTISDADYPPAILQHADKALYYAKEHGRNQVHLFEQLVESGELSLTTDSGDIDLF